jgi:glycosyltransferase involved in cell wall biosynthesis
MGYEVTVYSPHFHPYDKTEYEGVKIQKIYCPEKRMGSAAHFVYDYLSLRHAIRSGFDVIYAAGYGTLAPSLLRYRRVGNLVVNMDGIEWERSKWNGLTKQLMRFCERVTVRHPATLISDNKGIQEYYKTAFGRDSIYMAYGANPVFQFDETVPSRYDLRAGEYYLCIARLEPENNIEPMLDGYLSSKGPARPFVVVGNYQSRYGKYLSGKYNDGRVRFLGPIYDKKLLDSLRHYARIYFHGHSVGGTNPSLLEAMGSGCLIAAHRNRFNQSVLQGNALYFSDAAEVASLMDRGVDEATSGRYIANNYRVLEAAYSWEKIIGELGALFESMK